MTDTSYDWQCLLKQYKKYVNKTKFVIEVGASNIQRTKNIARLCKKLTGVEYYSERIPANFKNVTYIQDNWQTLSSTQSNSFDILVSSHTIEHVKKDLSAINHTYRILKKNGIALITTPNRQRLIRIIIELFTGKRKFPYWEHQREYSYHDLVTLLSKSKFKDFQITPIAFGINGGKFRLYIKKVPKVFRNHACFWLIKLHKK